MQVLFAFEQLIINTEDPDDDDDDDYEDDVSESGLNLQQKEELIKIKAEIDSESDPYMKA